MSRVTTELLDNVLDTLTDQFQDPKQRQITSEVSQAVTRSKIINSVVDSVTSQHLNADEERCSLLSMGITVGLAMSKFIDFEKVRPS